MTRTNPADRRRWLVKMLQCAYEDEATPGLPWHALVPVAVSYGGRAVDRPGPAEFEAVRDLTVGELYGAPAEPGPQWRGSPWVDELLRYRYVNVKLGDMLAEWEADAKALAGNASGRETAEGQAAGRELARAAEELRGTLGAALPPGAPKPAPWIRPGAWDWINWHLAELGRLLREHGKAS
jgi:hypothetical protein